MTSSFKNKKVVMSQTEFHYFNCMNVLLTRGLLFLDSKVVDTRRQTFSGSVMQTDCY